MHVIGRGFLAGHLAGIATRHDDAVVLAAGVSWTAGTSTEAFDREAALVREAAVRCRRDGLRLVFFSTASTGVYGACEGPGREDARIEPGNPYAAHKVGLEREIAEIGPDYLVLRLSHLVGPGQPAHQLLPTLVSQMHEGAVRIHHGARRDLVDVADVVRIVDLLLGSGLTRQTVNVASGAAIGVDEIVDHLALRLGLDPVREYVLAGGNHEIAIDKLRGLVPEVGEMGFGPDYFRPVLDRFVSGSLVTGLRTAAAS